VTSLRFSIDEAATKQIELHLLACASAFRPPLDSRVSIPAYSAKLASRATRHEAWAGSALVGLVATYHGDANQTAAFITNVSVHPDFQRRGIARRLIADAVRTASDVGMVSVDLEVDPSSTPALELYAAIGFKDCGEPGTTRRMRLDLRTTP
jgi:ribosomal protein S18 acetylase RimI-like enzyme